MKGPCYRAFPFDEDIEDEQDILCARGIFDPKSKAQET
jgi:hypothetical protein